jgi:hypothetical protein
MELKSATTVWEHPYRGYSGTTTVASIEAIDHFSARGMRRVYGRGDHFDRRTFHLDIWRNRNNRLLVRFWSYCNDVDGESWELFGVPAAQFLTGQPFNESWVPDCLRNQYDQWVVANF